MVLSPASEEGAYPPPWAFRTDSGLIAHSNSSGLSTGAAACSQNKAAGWRGLCKKVLFIPGRRSFLTPSYFKDSLFTGTEIHLETNTWEKCSVQSRSWRAKIIFVSYSQGNHFISHFIMQHIFQVFILSVFFKRKHRAHYILRLLKYHYAFEGFYAQGQYFLISVTCETRWENEIITLKAL